MQERKSPITMAALLVCLTGVSLYGCSTKATLSKEEQTNFRGGPPPPGFFAEAEKRKAAAENRVPANYKAWNEQRNAALKHGAAPSSNSPTPR
jgi:hypothetical protein